MNTACKVQLTCYDCLASNLDPHCSCINVIVHSCFDPTCCNEIRHECANQVVTNFLFLLSYISYDQFKLTTRVCWNYKEVPSLTSYTKQSHQCGWIINVNIFKRFIEHCGG